MSIKPIGEINIVFIFNMAPSTISESYGEVTTSMKQPIPVLHSKMQPATDRANMILTEPLFTPPPSRFKPLCHPLEPQVTHEVNEYFLKNWHFTGSKEKAKFVAAGFPRVVCLYYPRARDDRIHFACRLLTLLFLTDGMYLISLPL